MALFALTIFASAFLLFLVQPIIAKEILPWFGGSAAVWTTCLVFFQTALLAGYAYADVAVRRLAPRPQAILHVALLAASLVSLPIVPAAFWKPLATENPVALILGLLALTLGLPYFLLSTTNPLLQAWFARRFPGRNPYRLFALSNFASLAALLAYPFVIEPRIPTRVQALAWSAGYALFALLCAGLAWRNLGSRGTTQAPAMPVESTREPAPPAARQVLWCSLAALGSVLLLAVTTHITRNIAAVPLLWIVPLSVYLLTFVLCFEGRDLYPRDLVLAAATAAIGVMAWSIADARLTHELAHQVVVFLVGLFLACMFCHGELARLRPGPAHLTRFYLMVSLGGAIGAALVGIVAPLTLPANFELAIALAACACLLTWQVRRDAPVFVVLGAGAIAVTVACAVWGIAGFYDFTIASARNFYGVVRVQETGSAATLQRTLMNGTIMHGEQYLAPELRDRATTYYTTASGVGRLFETLHPRMDPLRVGVIGLGAGTLAAYGTPGDVYRFYEINPAVVAIAKRDFSYLARSEARVETVQGDARLALEREPPQRFDVLVVDAFSGDAIPVHLITAEALALYARHVKPDGVIAFHLTNRWLELEPVVGALAAARGMEAVWIHDDGGALANISDWVLVSNNRALLAKPLIAEAARPIPSRQWRLWTDDFNDLIEVFER